MTLLINDICTAGDLRNGYILTVADRRISYPKDSDGCYPNPQHHHKIFKIPDLNATVGYFGLAEYPYAINDKYFPLSEWLKTFIGDNRSIKTIEEFARCLCKKLNSSMARKYIKGQESGFHICGYNDNDIPEFWTVYNLKTGHIF